MKWTHATALTEIIKPKLNSDTTMINLGAFKPLAKNNDFDLI
jgi:hypothetical protein